MKHKPIKRLLALLLVCTMFLGLLSVSASAEDTPTEPELKLVSTAEGSLKKGDTFTVEVQFPKDEEFSNFEFYFDFDLETFKLTAVNTSYQAELADGSTIELPYIPNLVVTPNTTSFRDEETGNTYGGAIASATGTLNTKATKGILFTMEFEALTCCTAPKNISIYNKNFQKSTDYSTFESITPVIIPAEITINHTLTAVPAKDATCTEDGNDAYWSCSACGKLFSDANGETEITTAPVISALGHDYGTPEYNWTQAENGYECTATRTCTRENEHVETETVDAVYSVSSVATCTEDGEGLYTATFTNTAFAAQTKTVVLTALGHDYSVAQHDETSHWKKCSRCDSTTTSETHSFEAHSCDVAAKCTGCDYVKPAGTHSYGDYTQTQAPTCTTAGLERAVCTICNHEDVREIPALGHDYGTPEYNWTQTETDYECTATRTCTRDSSHVETETVDAVYSVSSAATCTEDGEGLYTATFTNAAFAAQTKTVVLTALGHDYSVAQHNDTSHWKKCSRCDSTTTPETHSFEAHSCDVAAKCTGCDYVKPAGTHSYGDYTQTQAPTCTTAGLERAVCTICNHEDVREIPALGHDYGTPEYSWTQAENGYECTATRTCTRDNEHVETETVDAVYSVSSVATCTEDGEGLYTATFTNTAFAAQTKTVVLTALGHDYSVAQHNDTSHWKKCSRCDSTTTPETHSFEAHSCDVAVKCTGCDYVKPAGTHSYGDYTQTQAPTCTTAGLERAVCTICNHEDVREVPALGHDYGTPEYSWTQAENGYECTATRTCTRDNEHVETETVDAVYSVSSVATCTEDGEGLYTATFTNTAFAAQTKTVVLTALGHDYGAPEYNWTQAENGYECTATRTCTRDNEHVETETVDAVYSVSSVATCTEDGEGLYTATFTNTAFAAQTKTVVLTALGHDYSVAQHNETSHWKKCSRCDSTTTSETHSFEAHSCDVAAKCTGCDYVKPATSHKTEHHARIEPTCTAAGNIEYWQCSVCGKKFSDAACTTEVQDTTLAKVPHSAGTVWEKDQNNHWHVCTICGTEVMDKAAHTYGDWTIIKDATETEAGSRKRTCTVCGYEQTEEISILRFTVTVHNGSGSGEYKSGETVTITANRRSGYTFEKWTVNAGAVVLGKETDATTSFTMPAENVTVTATYRYNGGSGSGSSSSGIVIKDENGKVIGKANPDTGIVELPITPVPAASSSRQAEEIEITIPKNTTVKVEIPVRNVTPGTVVAIVHADGTEEIVRTSVVTKNGIVLELDSSATVKVYDNSQSFSDVPATNWASDAVAFASSRELFNGTGAGTFSPNAPMTRQMLMTVLARLDGTDTSGNAYAKGMEWAIRNGVSNGSDPEGRITREQLATMLWRYAGSPSVSGRMSGFADTDQISSYAEDAMLWATKSGIIGGKGGNQLDPKGYATRAEVAAMLMRYCNTLFTK